MAFVFEGHTGKVIFARNIFQAKLGRHLWYRLGHGSFIKVMLYHTKLEARFGFLACSRHATMTEQLYGPHLARI